MLARMWRDWKPHALLGGLEVGAAVVQQAVGYAMKLHVESHDPTIPILGVRA